MDSVEEIYGEQREGQALYAKSHCLKDDEVGKPRRPLGRVQLDSRAAQNFGAHRSKSTGRSYKRLGAQPTMPFDLSWSSPVGIEFSNAKSCPFVSLSKDAYFETFHLPSRYVSKLRDGR